MVRYLLLSLIFCFTGTLVFSQTSLRGKIKEGDSGEDLIGANVVLYQNGNYKAGTSTDFDGNYSIGVDPGTYDVEVSYIGYPTKRVAGVLVKAGQANKLDVEIGGADEATGITLEDIVVVDYKVPLIEQDNTTSGQTITSEQIRNLPIKDVTALAAQAAGLSQADEGSDVTVRGSRSNATNYYVDGIRVRDASSLIPQTEIDQLQVITGGIEAQYGDVTGGIISITSKGPSSTYTGVVEVESSEFLDSYGYNLLSAALSGPILKKSNGESLLGFRFSGQYRYQQDDDPPATDIFYAKDITRAQLAASPVTTLGATSIAAAEELGNEAVDVLDYNPNEESFRLDLTGKLDARLSNSIDVSLTGAYSYFQDRFTPGGWQVYNSQNNPYSYDTRYRANFRFRHRLGQSGLKADAEGQEGKKGSIIQNAQYTLQAGYEKQLFERYDDIHKDNLFNYGHVGNFDYVWTPVFGSSDWSEAPAGIGHIDNRQEFRGYTAGTSNPGLAAYNSNADPANENDLTAQNGFFVGGVNTVWSTQTNINQVYNQFLERDNEIYTLNVSSSFDLMPGGSAKGRHSIQFGFIYEQRINRGYQLNPRRLWIVGRQQANRHILGVDTTNIIGYDKENVPLFLQQLGIDSLAVFGTLVEEAPGLQFYRNVRNITGQGLGEYVNVDGLTPDQLTLDLFSAQELTDDANTALSFWGFDYLGNKLGTDVTFNEFWTARDANGIRSFPVAPQQPIYAAAYIQDKFTFRDIIFRLGVRVDRYDANTKVLRDQYSLYPIQSAGEFYNNNPNTKPAAVGDDYKVYVAEQGSQIPVAFRDGDQWFFPNGNAANDGNVIFGGGVVTPAYVNPDENIKSDQFNVDGSFEDYEVQVNWMPRMAFSFPISDEANFFAHYDILVQRPFSNTLATPLDYFYFEDRPGSAAAPFNNPNLKPERTIDYEVGFQQRLSNTSALKISAYYKEMRDMIQRQTVLFVPSPIGSYVTYGNLDFGTTKGFSFQYDLRRTGNVTLQANYTLQFAEGTGSNANSQRQVSNRGNLRYLFPLDFDERHRINLNFDYRYATGKRYNGPRIAGKDILANAGLNIQAIAVSGRPYTQNQTPQKRGGSTVVGQLNGARKPWTFTLNLRLDKSFNLTPPDAKRQLSLNVYFRVQNLLDRQNVLNVYPVTGSPDDDGYLASSVGIGEIQTLTNAGRDVDSFLASYQWALINPNFFALPRRMYLGAIFDF